MNETRTIDVDLFRVTVNKWNVLRVVCKCGRTMDYDPCGWTYECPHCDRRVNRNLFLGRTYYVRQELYHA